MSRGATGGGGQRVVASISSPDESGCRLDFAANNIRHPTCVKKNVLPNHRRTTYGKKIKPNNRQPSAGLRPSKNVHTIIRQHRRMQRYNRRLIQPVINQQVANYSGKSAKENRIRLAGVLITLAALFVVCWVPYSTALLIWSFIDTSVTTHVLRGTLLLAHAHAALSPMVYWWMTRSCTDCVRSLCSVCATDGPIEWCVQTCACAARPRHTSWVHNSSTNEENLGPFHPKYLERKMIRPQISRCTSHYFH